MICLYVILDKQLWSDSGIKDDLAWDPEAIEELAEVKYVLYFFFCGHLQKLVSAPLERSRLSSYIEHNLWLFEDTN